MPDWYLLFHFLSSLPSPLNQPILILRLCAFAYTVSCSPCQTSPSRIQILKKYCQADVAVKARVISATPFGNTSSLVVTLDRNMERLLLPPDMRPSKKADNTAEEMPSPGFLDTNDERYLSPNGVRNANAREVVPLTAKNSQKPTEGPQNDSSSEFKMQRYD
ncbi:unnamed protein product [Dibothriocephalus latus]|uniref:Uncharacterized protein n=1 Tax=Dibothriocephalus latus TaxID=60516 RepID=A0A3P6TJ14_DIBLA|nr:unnamed protein product [Dibothriocephalus latus]